MSYVPHTDADRAEMLAAIGVQRIEDLFHDVPEDCRFPELALPEPLSEMEIMAELQAMSEENLDTGHFPCFLGAGSYNHYVPRVVDQIINRSEFYTAYTPYQPEISQGTLQSIFEYQSMICALTGMDVANASHYDGATATAEAAIMALNVGRGKRKKVVVSPLVHPEYRAVLRTYTQGMDVQFAGGDDPATGLDELLGMVDKEACCLIVQNPNFLGQIESLDGVADRVQAAGALLVVVADPISLGLLKAPGDYGADIVVGDAQGLGNGLNFGGPYLGYFACREKDVRKMAGRLVGQTVDSEGKRGFVLTLSTREQHIRREKATSNICTNQALCALATAIHLAALGPRGMRQLAELCYHKAHYTAGRIQALEQYQVVGDGPFFQEFVVRCPAPVRDVNDYLLEEWGIIGGYDLGRDYPDLENHMLVCVTEVIRREEIDALVDALAEAGKEVAA
ncbi:MAG: aminomethyl-transferring glycine dehydrogenase subunit GcvPA [Anaerolineae bacterium]|jgi:glycine dehydrogenase subunit 1|nr:aminomethyl-transferring glycine dehydrogenase subunit GcvPA [Anaerolineae bacterium]